ncbi:hypothetical protein [Microbulbifer sp. SAOS-129_SWC]|uniref:flagellar basal body rod protein FlgB n=1 Tax=Microbulbifer sp. SAOS-129_SWC TaxID=3145235 RepID=UPI00321793B0
MINNVTDLTSDLVKTALDANLQQQQISAHNIANANSDGYRALALNFSDIYADAENLLSGDESQNSGRFEGLRNEIHDGAYVHATGSNVALDMEMVRLNEVVVQYQALLQGLSKYGSLVKMAITGEVGR